MSKMSYHCVLIVLLLCLSRNGHADDDVVRPPRTFQNADDFVDPDREEMIKEFMASDNTEELSVGKPWERANFVIVTMKNKTSDERANFLLKKEKPRTPIGFFFEDERRALDAVDLIDGSGLFITFSLDNKRAFYCHGGKCEGTYGAENIPYFVERVTWYFQSTDSYQEYLSHLWKSASDVFGDVQQATINIARKQLTQMNDPRKLYKAAQYCVKTGVLMTGDLSTSDPMEACKHVAAIYSVYQDVGNAVDTMSSAVGHARMARHAKEKEAELTGQEYVFQEKSQTDDFDNPQTPGVLGGPGAPGGPGGPDESDVSDDPKEPEGSEGPDGSNASGVSPDGEENQNSSDVYKPRMLFTVVSSSFLAMHMLLFV